MCTFVFPERPGEKLILVDLDITLALWAKYIFLYLFEMRTPVPERFMAFPWPQINSKCLYLGLVTQIDGNSLIWQ